MIIKNLKYLCFLVLSCSSMACAMLRTDLPDRPKEDVLQKSYALGKSLTPSQFTCFICSKSTCLGASGVALDPWTILTCAQDLNINEKSFWISFSSDIKDDPVREFQRSVESITVHPSFQQKAIQKLNYYISCVKGRYSVLGKSFEDLEHMTFQEYSDNIMLQESFYFRGADLAIFKLKKRLPFAEGTYPTLYDAGFNSEKNYGISVGYGTAHYNLCDRLAIPVEPRGSSNKRHVISLNLKPHTLTYPYDYHVLYGDYTGFFINGEHSFIPHDRMLKTEGLPVGGDSGGGFFIKHNDAYKLAGMCSITKAFCASPVQDLLLRNELKNFKQKIFPEFVDVTRYKDWITSHMGPTYS